MRTSLILFFVLFSLFSFAQNDSKDNRKLVQFSGVVVNSETLNQIPFTSIMVKNTIRGTIGDYSGYFSFVAQELDTIIFSYIGYSPTTFVIPDTLSESRYSLIQIMKPDTVLLPEAVIYPWPSKEQFKEAFINLNVPSDDYDRAMRNLALAEMRERVSSTPIGPDGNFNAQMQIHQSRLYSAGQYPTYNILNPVAWANFISAWRNGDLKKK